MIVLNIIGLGPRLTAHFERPQSRLALAASTSTAATPCAWVSAGWADSIDLSPPRTDFFPLSPFTLCLPLSFNNNEMNCSGPPFSHFFKQPQKIEQKHERRRAALAKSPRRKLLYLAWHVCQVVSRNFYAVTERHEPFLGYRLGRKSPAAFFMVW